MKGYEYEKGEFVLLEQDEIDAVKLESKKTLELTQFVDASEIDVLYYEKPYFVVPADDPRGGSVHRAARGAAAD